MSIDTQQAVLRLLQEFRGEEPLKELFWSQLNYNRINRPLSRRNWPDRANEALADDPLLLAGHDDFHVIYSRLKDRLLLGLERPVVSRLVQEYPYALFVFSDVDRTRWHFVNVKYDPQSTKRRLFRRITIGPEERLRTASQRIDMLDLESISPDLFGISPLAIQELHDEAFDVEAVQKEFFKIFAELYHNVANDIEKVPGLKKEAGKLAQLLLDRMLFLYFIQKKGWLDNNPSYLYERFRSCWKKDPKGHSYYSEVLYPLFLCLSNPGMQMNHIGSVPFLNGGLFEETAIQTQEKRLEQARLKIKNSTFKAIFDDLLERFNFTVTEDTPLDVEVAIDPEMLGKIFESLILQLEKDPGKDLRKLTGSYYTPRPIVHFMCQESLREYLATQLEGSEKALSETMREKVDSLLSMPPADHLDDEQLQKLEGLFTTAEAKALRQAILDCRVCDPAVGSGAFPVGMLHEMVAAIARLDLRIDGPDVLKHRNYHYDLKKQIIESCLYGVDIQEQAVRLCELRLWLSLIVDYEIDPTEPFTQAIRDIPSLPNLSYRILRGDSLLERLFGHVVQLDQMAQDAKAQQLIESIQADKHSYFREGSTSEKRRLELKILAKQADLAERLVEAKRKKLAGYQASMLDDELLTSKERKIKSEHISRVKEFEDLKQQVYAAKVRIEKLTPEPRIIDRGDLDKLRSQFFDTKSFPAFIWRIDFAEIFSEKEGFDIVIGNPPYLGARDITDAEFINDLKAIFKFKDDYYTYFILTALNIARPRGIHSFICSKTFLTLTGKEYLRRAIQRYSLRYILEMPQDTFEAHVYPCCYLVRLDEPKSDELIMYGNLTSSSKSKLGDLSLNLEWKSSHIAKIGDEVIPVEIAETCSTQVYRTPHNIFRKCIFGRYFEPSIGSVEHYNAYIGKIQSLTERWAEIRKDGSCHFDRIHKDRKEEFVDFLKDNDRPYVLLLGMILNMSDVGIHTRNCRHKLFYSEQKKPRLELLLQGRQIKKYVIDWNSPKAKYKWVDIHYTPIPGVKGIGRGGKPSKHDEYWDWQGDPEIHKVPERILIRQTEDDVVAAYVDQRKHHYYTDNTLFTCITTPYGEQLGFDYFSLVALLNSDLINSIYHFVAQEGKKSQAQVKITYLNLIPVVIPSTKQIQDLRLLGKDAVSFAQSDDSAMLEKIRSEIEQCVREVYSVSEELIVV